MSRLRVERIGGLAGFGLPGSRLRSVGEVEPGALSGADRAAVESLFAPGRPAAAPAPDEFVYRITRRGARGDETVEVAEHDVPEVLRDCVSDELA
jgi:hypothetical protein